MEMSCRVCGAATKLTCERCSDPYCGIKCQILDWKSHRFICIPMPKLVARPMNVINEIISKNVEPVAVKRSVSTKEPEKTEQEVEQRSKLTQKMSERRHLDLPRGLKLEKEITIEKKLATLSLNDKKPVVPTPTGLISSLLALNNNLFKGHINTIFTENLFSIIVQMPDILLKKYDALMTEFAQNASEFERSELKPGLMIPLKHESKYIRAIVISYDLDANACVVYYCDSGEFDVLFPIPQEIKECPSKYVNFPYKSVFVELANCELDREKLFQSFVTNALTFEIKKKRNNFFNGSVCVENASVVGEVVMYDTSPELNMCNINFWTIQPRSGTVVRVIRIKIDDSLHAWIIPTNAPSYDTILHDIGRKLDHCKCVPPKGSLVVHVQGQRGGRLTVTKHLPDDMVEVSDLDNRRIYKIEWKQLKIGNNFVKNLPAFGMSVKLEDEALRRFEKDEILEFLDSIEYRKKEFVLEFEGLASNGVKLIMKDEETMTLVDLIVKSLKEKKQQRDELTRKQKGRESEDLKDDLNDFSVKNESPKIKLESDHVVSDTQDVKNDKISIKDRLLQKNIVEKIDEKPEIFLNDLKLIPLEEGKTAKFIITDPGTDGMVGLCEDSDENKRFLGEILVKCENYVSKVDLKALSGYSPMQEEMCLVCYSDGNWYRATCVTNDGPSSIVLILVDFGTFYITKTSQIIPFPEELKEPSLRTHLAIINESEKQKTIKLETYGQYKFKVQSCNDGIYNLSHV